MQAEEWPFYMTGEDDYPSRFTDYVLDYQRYKEKKYANAPEL